MSKGRKPKPQLVGSHPVGTGAIGKEIHVLFLDAVLQVTASAIKLLVQSTWLQIEPLGSRVVHPSLGKVSHDKARIVTLELKSPLCQSPGALWIALFRVRVIKLGETPTGSFFFALLNLCALRASKCVLSSSASRSRCVPAPNSRRPDFLRARP